VARLRLTTPLAALALWTGCLNLGGGSHPTTFYLLSSLASGPPSADAARPAVSVGVGPLSLPAHLNRPQIVTRADGNRLELAEFDNWGEPLRANLGRVLAENLAALLGTDRVWTYPWPRSAAIDYRIRVDVERFAAGPDPNVHLRCRWTLADPAGRPLQTRLSQIDVPVASLTDYPAIVEAMSRGVEALAREMAVAVVE
jgi:uncharacterized lipoprotein YmbA